MGGKVSRERKRRSFHWRLLPGLKLRTVPREDKEALYAQQMKAGGNRSKWRGTGSEWVISLRAEQDWDLRALGIFYTSWWFPLILDSLMMFYS